GGEVEAPHEERRLDRVVRVRARDVLRERPRGPGERERRSEARPAEPPPDEAEAEQAEEVPEDRGRVHGRERVPLAAPPERDVAGDVRLVRHRAVRVAAVVRGLAAAVRLDAVPDLAGRVRWAAGG